MQRPGALKQRKILSKNFFHPKNTFQKNSIYQKTINFSNEKFFYTHLKKLIFYRKKSFLTLIKKKKKKKKEK